MLPGENGWHGVDSRVWFGSKNEGRMALQNKIYNSCGFPLRLKLDNSLHKYPVKPAGGVVCSNLDFQGVFVFTPTNLE